MVGIGVRRGGGGQEYRRSSPSLEKSRNNIFSLDGLWGGASASAEIFVGWGTSLKKAPHKVKKGPHMEKNNKNAPQIAKKKKNFQWKGGRPRTLAPPPPAGANGGRVIATFSPCWFLLLLFSLSGGGGGFSVLIGGGGLFWGFDIIPLSYKKKLNIVHHRFISHDL